MEYMDQDCSTCQFCKRNISKEPCNSCVGWSAGNGSNWQPRKPRRKELQAEIDRLTAERAKWVEWHQNRDDELHVANDEIESMHNELAAKEREIAEHRRHVATVMQREAENARILAAVKHENQSLYEYRTRSIEDLKAKQAIIDKLKSELDEVKASKVIVELVDTDALVKNVLREIANAMMGSRK